MNDDNKVIVVEAGTATAYGSAVEGGYTGTYEDFCRQQAGYAENAQAVEQAKQDAITAKNQAQTAKDDAVTAKNNAVSAKDDAVSAKNTAVSAKDDAVSAKNTATTKAQEASASATNAGQSATSASQSAQSAEQSAQGVSGSLAQIQTNTTDISQLKADLDSFKVSMILDLSDIRDAYQSGTAGNVVSFISTTATKTIVHAISVRSGKTYTINARYGSAVSSAGTRACMCVDDSDVVIQQVLLPVTANSTNTATFKALQDGFLNVSVDSKYESIEIIGFDPNAAATVQKSVNANSEIIAEIKTDVKDTKVKAKLISCLRNMGWSVANGYYYLLAFCEAIGVNGWVDVKPKTSIDSTTGNTVNDAVWRQASYFINVDSYTSIESDFADSDNYKPYYVVRCYNSEKEYIGTAETSGGSVGIIIGTTTRFFPQNTSYIRLLLAPNPSADPNLDLIGVYTGRVLELTLTDSNQTTTKRKYALVEVEDFSDV